MKSRDQDDLAHLPSLSISEDELSHRPASHGGWSPDHHQEPVVVKRSSGWGAFMITFLMLALFGASGVGYWQLTLMQKELVEARNQLQTTASRLLEVSGTISKTDESFSRNEGAVRDELKAVNFEIRKLWDLANKANKPELERQGKRLTALSKNVTAVEGELAGFARQLRTMNAELSAGTVRNGEQVEELQKKLVKLSGTVQTVAANHKKNSDSVNKRLRTYQNQLKAVDAHRQQVSRRLQQLENSVRSLSGGGNVGGLTIEPQ